jgi:type II secretory pathway pseudopilin PulG
MAMKFRTQRGMGLLEAVISAVMISLLIVVFFGRILSMSASIERESMQQTVSHLNSALNIEALTLIIKNNQAAIENWVGKNPMQLINPPPPQYRGSFADADAFEVSPGSWFFDEKKGMLIYRINHIEAFAGGRAIPERVRFRVEASFNDMNNNQRRDENERYTGLKLRALDDYQWSSATVGVVN